MPRKLPANCVPWMRPHQAEKLIRQLAANTSNIRWSAHALERMPERGIPDVVAVEVLRTGFVKGEVEPGSNPGEWKAKMSKEVKGRREVGVVTIIVRSERLFVKTVEWEDL
jgi:Domain of unknown function (DUF4258)